jgi:PKD repeat protein
MFMVLMISRLRRVSVLAAMLAGSALLTIACEKVPLLAPSGSSITLTALATALPSNGTTDIIAQVIEASGTPPHSGTHITFTTNLGTVQPSEADTDIAGRVTVKYVAGSGSGTATITAISGGVSASGTNAVKILIGAAAAASIGVNASPGTVSSTGGISTISAKVLDTNGNLLPGVPVTFSTDNGSLSATVSTTDSTGTATTQLTTNKTAKVTATTGVSTPASGTGTTATTAPTGSITVNVNAVSAIAVGAPSPASPTVGIPVTFPLTITPNANGSAIQRVVVDFGDGSAAVTLPGTPSSATHTYTSVGSFSVRATATDAFGDIAVASGSVTVGARPQPTISITTSANPTAGATTTFTLSVAPAANSGTVISDVTIDFGDGSAAVDLGATSGTAISVQHIYQTGGTYTVTAIARDSNGGTAPASTVLVVPAATPLTVLLSASSTPSGANTTESFTATVIGLGNSVVVNYHWVFGSTLGTADTTSNQQTRTYVAGTGTITVTVTVTTSTGAQATGQTVIVIP